MRKGRIALVALAAAAAGLSLFNASWIAPKPQGRLELLARHGVAIPFDPDAEGCTARAIAEPRGMLIENTLFALRNAVTMGAQGFALDVHATADGRAVVFRDETLDCRTDGTGAVADRSLAELKALDVGHGYTADGGGTFPLRGRGVGGMLTVEEVVRAYPDQPILFVLHGPGAADAVLGDFARAGVEIGPAHGFSGDPASLRRLRARTHAGWLLERQASQACLDSYVGAGWLGIVPEVCRGRTLGLPLEGRSRWTIWGWPYRFLDRIADADGRMLVLSRWRGERPLGLTEPEQLGEVPRSFKGLLLVEDMARVGRSLER